MLVATDGTPGTEGGDLGVGLQGLSMTESAPGHFVPLYLCCYYDFSPGVRNGAEERGPEARQEAFLVGLNVMSEVQPGSGPLVPEVDAVVL